MSSGDPNQNAVADDARAPGDGAAVAAALANDGCGFAGDRRFVHAGNAFDDVAVGRNHVARFAHDDVALLQIRGGDLLFASVPQTPGDRVLSGLPQAGGLCFTAAFGDRFGEIGEEHREPEPNGELGDETAQPPMPTVKIATVVGQRRPW